MALLENPCNLSSDQKSWWQSQESMYCSALLGGNKRLMMEPIQDLKINPCQRA